MRISASDGYKRKALDRWSRTCVPPPLHTLAGCLMQKKIKVCWCCCTDLCCETLHWRRSPTKSSRNIGTRWFDLFIVIFTFTKNGLDGFGSVTSTQSKPRTDLGPLHTQAKSRDHVMVRAQMKVSNGRPKTPPTSCSSVVTDPWVWCEVICDWALNQMLFQWISIHAGLHAW